MKNKIIRWTLVFLGIFFNLLNYLGSPYRLSSKDNCVGPFKCYNGYFYIFIIIFVLQVLFVLYLNSIEIPITKLPKLWWISIPFIFGVLFINIYSGNITYNFDCRNYKKEDDCNYKTECMFKKDMCLDKYFSKPWSVFSKGFRSFTTYGLLLILSVSFVIEYFNNYIPSNEPLNFVILNRFGGIKNNPITSSFAWIQIITIILSIIILHTNNTYIPCKYNLPSNWK